MRPLSRWTLTIWVLTVEVQKYYPHWDIFIKYQRWMDLIWSHLFKKNEWKGSVTSSNIVTGTYMYSLLYIVLLYEQQYVNKSTWKLFQKLSALKVRYHVTYSLSLLLSSLWPSVLVNLSRFMTSFGKTTSFLFFSPHSCFSYMKQSVVDWLSQ